jgi:hypothetical protein
MKNSQEFYAEYEHACMQDLYDSLLDCMPVNMNIDPDMESHMWDMCKLVREHQIKFNLDVEGNRLN